MFNYTFNNHLKYFIDDEPFATRTSQYQRYSIDVGKIDLDYYKKNNYETELLRIADIQYHDLGKNLVLFLSGGTDSEIVARSFIKIGFKPQCLIIRFANGYNNDEVIAAEETAKALNLPYYFYDVDVHEFYFSGEAMNLAKRIQCKLLPFLVLFKVIESIKQPSIYCGELQMNLIKTKDNVFRWYLRLFENMDTSHMRLSQQINVPIIQEWFSYTPEIMLYYLTDPDFIFFLRNPGHFTNNVYVKNKILQKLVPDIFKKEKGTGYERLHGLKVESYMEFERALINEISGRMNPYLFYKELINKLKGAS
jgi:hypothetical protein